MPRGAFRQIRGHDEASSAGCGQYPDADADDPEHGDDEHGDGVVERGIVYPRGWNEPRKLSASSMFDHDATTKYATRCAT